MRYARIVLALFLVFSALVFVVGATEGPYRGGSVAFAVACAVGAWYLWPRKPKRVESAWTR